MIESEGEEKDRDAWVAERAGQSILPGFRRDVGPVPVDRRPWRAASGQQIDSPAYGGPEFLGKIIPPVTEPDGSDVQLGSFQVMRDARGTLVVVDWGLPFDRRWRPPGEFDSPVTPPIMGRTVYRTREGLVRAKNAMRVLFADKRDRARGLERDPAVVKDLRGKEIRLGGLVLCRFERGPRAGGYAAVNEALAVCERGRVELLQGGDLKTAFKAFTAFCAKQKGRSSARATGAMVLKKKFVGAPIAFEAPAGFGARAPIISRDARGAGPGSDAWKASVALYARTGKWCKTAMLVWGDARPAELVAEAEEARMEWLEGREKGETS